MSKIPVGKLAKILLHFLILFSLLTACKKPTKHVDTSLSPTNSSETFLQFAKEPIIKAPEILEYIENKNNLIALTDKRALSPHIGTYYQNILDFLYQHNMDKGNYYVKITGIDSSEFTINIPIFHYAGFIKEKELKDENKQAELDQKNGKPADFKRITGNMSGKDGSLEIDKKTKMVLSFKLWQ